MENRKTTTVYVASTDTDKINLLGEDGWQILSKSPLVIGKPFEIDHDASVLNQYREFFEKQANRPGTPNREKLEKRGFYFKRVYNDSIGRKVWRLDPDHDGSALYKWRVEFPYDPRGAEPPIIGITFGSPDMNVPLFCDKAIVDKYVPAGFLDKALADGSISVIDVKDE